MSIRRLFRLPEIKCWYCGRVLSSGEVLYVVTERKGAPRNACKKCADTVDKGQKSC
jgi:hypothetical protein